MSREEEINRLRAQAYSSISTDPVKATRQMLQSLDTLTAFATMMGLSEARVDQLSTTMIEEHHALFKAKVEEELLQSQKATNDALASALGMRGRE